MPLGETVELALPLELGVADGDTLGVPPKVMLTEVVRLGVTLFDGVPVEDGVPLALTLGVLLLLRVRVAVIVELDVGVGELEGSAALDCVTVRDGEREMERVGLLVRVGVPELLADTDGDGVKEGDAACEAVPLVVTLDEGVAEVVGANEAEALTDGLGVAEVEVEAVTEGGTDALGEMEAVGVPDTLGLAVSVAEEPGERDTEGLGVNEADDVALGEVLPAALAVPLLLLLAVAVVDAVVDAVALAVPALDGELVLVTEGVTVALTLPAAVALGDRVRDADAVSDAVADGDAVSDDVAEADRERVDVGVLLGVVDGGAQAAAYPMAEGWQLTTMTMLQSVYSASGPPSVMRTTAV